MNNDIDLTDGDSFEDADFAKMLQELMQPPSIRQSLGLGEDDEIPADMAFDLAARLIGAVSDLTGEYSQIAEGVEEDGTSKFATRVGAYAVEQGESVAPVRVLQLWEDFFQGVMAIENELRVAKYPDLPQVDDRGRDIV